MIEEIKSRVEKLISLYETEKQQLTAANAELEKCREQLAAYKEKVAGLEATIDQLKLQSAFVGGGDNALAKERITKLVREIDRCIKLLEEA